MKFILPILLCLVFLADADAGCRGRRGRRGGCESGDCGSSGNQTYATYRGDCSTGSCSPGNRNMPYRGEPVSFRVGQHVAHPASSLDAFPAGTGEIVKVRTINSTGQTVYEVRCDSSGKVLAADFTGDELRVVEDEVAPLPKSARPPEPMPQKKDKPIVPERP